MASSPAESEEGRTTSGSLSGTEEELTEASCPGCTMCRTMAAFSAEVYEATALSGWEGTPKDSRGETTKCLMLPASSSQT